MSGNPYIDTLNLDQLETLTMLQHNPTYSRAYRHRVTILRNERAEKITKEYIEKKAAQKKAVMQYRTNKGSRRIVSQSEIGLMKDNEDPDIVHHENLQEIDGATPAHESSGTSSISIRNGEKTQYSLDKFFERPVLLYTNIFGVSDREIFNINPWDLWSKDPSVRAKLLNYAYFRGTMNLSISISGSPYNYGRMMFSYYPYAAYNDMLSSYGDIYSSTDRDNLMRGFFTYISQAEGRAIVNVNTNEPVEMKLPFISYKNQFRLFNSSSATIGSVDSFEDFAEAGELYGGTINTIHSSQNDLDTDVVVNIYAWVTDIELGNTTNTLLDIQPQSLVLKKGYNVLEKTSKDLNGGDEYSSEGPVSSVASAVAGAAGKLDKVPIIGPYMKATSGVANTIGRIASYFGFSKPEVLEPPVFVKNMPFANAAVCAGHQTNYKIAVDPKCECTIDNTIGGSSCGDDMVLSTIFSRESYLTTFVWTNNDQEMVKRLWTCAVSPILYNVGSMQNTTTNTSFLVQPTSLMYGVLPFQYWRGSITYRFEIVASLFHRGKLLIKYEPNLYQYSAIVAGTATLNTNNCIVIDIQETTEFEFTVDWANSLAWLTTPSTALSSSFAYDRPPCGLLKWDETAIPTFTGNPAELAGWGANGFIQVIPFTGLVSPSGDQNVEINVYVKSDDLEVARPVQANMGQNRSYKVTPQSMVLNRNNAEKHSGSTELYFGEEITSFRQMLKRFTTRYEVSGVAGTGKVVRSQLFPFLHPNAAWPVGSDSTLDTEIFNYSLLEYLHYAYLGYRGSLRWRYRYSGSNAIISPVTVTLANLSNDDGSVAVDQSYNTTFTNKGHYSTFDGSVNFMYNTNAGIEVSIPWYSNYTFFFFTNQQPTAPQGVGTVAYELDRYAPLTNERISICQEALVETGEEPQHHFDVSTGEDFTLLRFQGAPFFSVAASI